MDHYRSKELAHSLHYKEFTCCTTHPYDNSNITINFSNQDLHIILVHFPELLQFTIIQITIYHSLSELRID
eukprot:c18784_g1_i1 orf=110-322(-)